MSFACFIINILHVLGSFFLALINMSSSGFLCVLYLRIMLVLRFHNIYILIESCWCLDFITYISLCNIHSMSLFMLLTVFVLPFQNQFSSSMCTPVVKDQGISWISTRCYFWSWSPCLSKRSVGSSSQKGQSQKWLVERLLINSPFYCLVFFFSHGS